MKIKELLREGIAIKTTMTPLSKGGVWYELQHTVIYDDRLLCAGCYIYLEDGKIKNFLSPMGSVENALKQALSL